MNKKEIKQKGAVIIITFLVLITLSVLGAYFLNFSLTESKTSRSQKIGKQTYYLAEAGINEAIWKLKNDNTLADGDSAWADDFVDCSQNPGGGGEYWSDQFTHYFSEGSYTVSIQNFDCGRGEIISTSSIDLPEGGTAQRMVKTTVFKSLESPIGKNAIFTGGASQNIDIHFSKLRIYDGDLFGNHNLNVKYWSKLEVYDNLETEDILEGRVLAGGNIVQTMGSSVTAEAICAKNTCSENCEGYDPEIPGCEPDSLPLPLVNFDSEDPNSFKSRAQALEDSAQCSVLCEGILCDNKCVYTSSEFEDLLWDVGEGGTLTLNGTITYVTGDVELRGGRHLVVNGILVVDGNVKIGERYSWTRQGQKDEGFSQIVVNRPGADLPSGLLTKRKIDFGLYSSFQSTTIEGLIYANDEMTMISMPWNFDVIGGIIVRKLSLTSVLQWLDIYLDEEIILYGLGYKIDGETIVPMFSPVITVDHWEEVY